MDRSRPRIYELEYIVRAAFVTIVMICLVGQYIRAAAFLFLGDNNYLPQPWEAYAVSREDMRMVFSDIHRTLRNAVGDYLKGRGARFKALLQPL